MGNRITLKQIAKQLNVSVSTVSKALNDSSEISLITKKRIRNYAKKHNYKRNKVALSLLNKKTKTIGVIVPNILNSFFSKVFAGIEEVTTANNYTLISCFSNESYEKEVNTMELLKHSTLDGFIISIAEETQVKEDYRHFQEAIDEGVEIVLFDRVTDAVNCDKVIVNDFEGAYNATNHLIQTGCKNIAVVSLIDNISVGKLRVQGYEKALRDSKKKFRSKYIIRIQKGDDFEAKLKPVLTNYNIDGLLCLEEKSVLKSTLLVKSLGYNIPNEISIICFTDGKIPKHITPSITTISQHAKIMGQTAAKKLIERLENPNDDKFSTTIINTSFIERQSTRRLNNSY